MMPPAAFKKATEARSQAQVSRQAVSLKALARAVQRADEGGKRIKWSAKPMVAIPEALWQAVMVAAKESS